MSNFYINRLKTFSVAEFPYRIKQMLIKQIEQRKDQERVMPPLAAVQLNKVLSPAISGKTDNSKSVDIFGKHFNYGHIRPEDWHTDIFSGKRFPMSFSKKISIRKDADLSAKTVWEINRLQFLMRIAINYQQTKQINELNQFIEIIKSWKQANPYLKGVNWYSNIEVNLRLIQWVLCWEVLNADELIEENEEFKSFAVNEWLPLIYQHCLYSYKNPSKYSSANNHLISEYAGLFVASVKWSFAESGEWIKYAQKGLETEIIKQHSNNGVNREEAAEYIQFITDFFLLAFVVGENSGYSFSENYKEQLKQIFNYISNFLDCNGNFPKYGDEDDGKCFIVDFDKSFNNFKSILTSGAIIFKDSFFKAGSNGYDLKNQVLFGEAGKKIFDAIEHNNSIVKSNFYTNEGHFFCKAKNESGEVYLHFDAAPLGFLSIAAHGHADALSFILHVDGQPVFVDPGTYTYHTAPEWRNYFVSTLSHNTVRINKKNQAEFAGSTLWLNHYKCTVIKAESDDETDIVKAMHNGYKSAGVTHTREIVFNKKKLAITIYDTIESKTQNSILIEMPFHFHPAVKIENQTSHLFNIINRGGRNLQLKTDEKLNTALICGQQLPEITGWYSDSFLIKEPSSTIIGSIEVTGNIQFETTILIN